MSLSLSYSFRGAPEILITFAPAKTTVVCGSGSERVDLALSGDPAIAPTQMKFQYWLGAWWVENLNPTCPLYFRGQELTGQQQLQRDDILALGGYLLRIQVLPAVDETQEDPGLVNARVPESELPARVSPDEQINVLVRVSDVAAHARTKQSLLEGFLRELTDAFPPATKRSILLIEDLELVVRVASPEPSTVSFTLARTAIQKREAFMWKRTAGTTAVTQLDTLSALYAPMLSAGRALGTLYLGSHLKENAFTERDLALLGLIANTMGAPFAASDSSIPHLPQVFLSYAHADFEFVNRLAGDLRRRQVKVWFDERLQTGEAWRRKLAAAIKSTDAFLILLSPESVKSKMVLWELTTAQQARKTVFPLLYQSCEIPITIRPLQYQAVGGSDTDRSNALDRLVEQLRRSLRKRL
jgi:hypothetical protein